MPAERGRELTLRGLALGIAITFVFTAANVYVGLRVGLTFATSIPAAVISMALLRLARRAAASSRTTSCRRSPRARRARWRRSSSSCRGWCSPAGGRASPFWPTFLLCATGGMIGVLVSVPLRRVLVTGSDLPYPEGVAAAEVLKRRQRVGRRRGGEPARAARGFGRQQSWRRASRCSARPASRCRISSAGSGSAAPTPPPASRPGSISR